MPTLTVAQEPVYVPVFEVSEEFSPELGDKKIGQQLQAILNYEVVEKTKSFLILRITGIYTIAARRKY